MSSEALLLKVPALVKTQILEKCDFLSIMILRKTCRSLRNFIDTTKPEQSINAIRINGDPDMWPKGGVMELILSCGPNDELYPLGQKINVNYYKEEDKATVFWYRSDENRKIILEGVDYKEAFMRDFECILNLKVSLLDYFFFFRPLEIELLDEIGLALKSRHTPIRAKSVNLIGNHEEDFMKILPYFCPESLKMLRFQRNKDRMNMPIKIEKIVELDQWKNSEEFKMLHLQAVTPIQRFAHFNCVHARFKRISADSINFLKETFLASSSSSKYFSLRTQTDNNEDNFIEALGPPSIEYEHRGDKSRKWFFTNWNNCEFVLKINVFLCFIQFKIISRSEVRDDIRIFSRDDIRIFS